MNVLLIHTQHIISKQFDYCIYYKEQTRLDAQYKLFISKRMTYECSEKLGLQRISKMKEMYTKNMFQIVFNKFFISLCTDYEIIIFHNQWPMVEVCL